MKIIRNIFEIKNQKASVATVGSFDGVHLGHQKLLKRIVKISKEKNLESIVVTFEPNPKEVLRPFDAKLPILTSTYEKFKIFEKLGVNKVVVIPFTIEFSRISYKDFLNNYLVKLLHVMYLVVGYDHSFGKNREGKYNSVVNLSKEINLEVEQVDQVLYKNKIAKSSLVRNLLLDGEIQLSNKLLGRQYELTGKVVKGEGRGKKLGFPTANLEIVPETKLIPKNGIYLVKVKFENKFYFGLLSIGTLPTFYNEHKIVVEVNLFKFAQEVYNKELTVYFIKYLREQKKFNSSDELIDAMEADKERSLKIIEKENILTFKEKD